MENLCEFKICVRKASPREGKGNPGLLWPRFRVECFFNGSKLYSKVVAILTSGVTEFFLEMVRIFEKTEKEEFKFLNGKEK